MSPPRLLFLSRTSDWTKQSIRNRSEKQRRCSKETKRKQRENSRAPNKYEMWHALQENQECYDYVNVKTSTFASKSIYPRRKTSNPYCSSFLYTICSFGVYSRHHTWSQFAISLGWTPYFALAPLTHSRNFLVASSFDISCSNGDSLLTPPNVEHAIETKLLCCSVRTWHVLNLVRLPYQKDIQVATRPVRRAASFEISKDTFETDNKSTLMLPGGSFLCYSFRVVRCIHYPLSSWAVLVLEHDLWLRVLVSTNAPVLQEFLNVPHESFVWWSCCMCTHAITRCMYASSNHCRLS